MTDNAPLVGCTILVKMPPWIEARVVDSNLAKDVLNLIPPFGPGDFFVQYLEGEFMGQLVRLSLRHEGKIWTRITGGR